MLLGSRPQERAPGQPRAELWDEAGTFVALPPPDDAAVTRVLHRCLTRLRPRLAALEEARLDDDDTAGQEAAQRVLVEVPAKREGGRRLAAAHGFSLHADTAVQAADRQGLEVLARSGARGGRWPQRGCAAWKTAATSTSPGEAGRWC